MAAYSKVTTLLAHGTLPSLQYILAWLSYFESGFIRNVWMQKRYVPWIWQTSQENMKLIEVTNEIQLFMLIY